MGFNTAMIVRNDYMNQIKGNAQFGDEVHTAISQAHRETTYGAFTVLPSMHADHAQVVVITANDIRLLGLGYWTEDDDSLLRTLAEQKGYKLVKKPARK